MKNHQKRTEKTVLLAHTGTGAGGSANEFAVERGERREVVVKHGHFEPRVLLYAKEMAVVFRDVIHLS